MSTLAILEGTLLAQAAGFAVHYQRGKRAFCLLYTSDAADE